MKRYVFLCVLLAGLLPLYSEDYISVPYGTLQIIKNLLQQQRQAIDSLSEKLQSSSDLIERQQQSLQKQEQNLKKLQTLQTDLQKKLTEAETTSEQLTKQIKDLQSSLIFWSVVSGVAGIVAGAIIF